MSRQMNRPLVFPDGSVFELGKINETEPTTAASKLSNESKSTHISSASDVIIRYSSENSNLDFSDTGEGMKFSRTGIPNTVKVGMTEQERFEALQGKQIKVVPLDPEKLKGKSVQHLKDVSFKIAKPLLKELMKEFGTVGKYDNAEISLDFGFSINSFNESFNKQQGRRFHNFAKMLAILPELSQNAIGINAYEDKYRGTKREDTRLKATYVLISAFQDGDSIIPVKLLVKEFVDQQNKLYVAITASPVSTKKIEASIRPRRTANVSAWTRGTPASSYSIADLLRNINPADGDLIKHIPDGFLDEERLRVKQDEIDKDNAKLKSLRGHKFENSRISIKDGGMERSISMPEIKEKNGIFYADFTVGGEKMKRTGKAQIDLIRDLGINKSTMATWCNGQKLPRREALRILAFYFGVTISDLVEETKDQKFNELSAQHSELLNLMLELKPHEAQRVRDFAAGVISSR